MKFNLKEGDFITATILEASRITSFSLGVVLKVERGRFQVAHANGTDWMSKKPEKGLGYLLRERTNPELPIRINYRREVIVQPLFKGAGL